MKLSESVFYTASIKLRSPRDVHPVDASVLEDLHRSSDRCRVSDSACTQDFVIFMRPILTISKILGVFPVKNVIFRRPGRKLQRSLISLEGIWSLAVFAALISLGYSWLTRVDYSGLVEIQKELKFIDHVSIYANLGAIHGTHIISCFLSVVLSSRWANLLESFNEMCYLFEPVQQKLRDRRTRYLILYAFIVIIHIAVCPILINQDPLNPDLHVLYTIGGIIISEIFIRMSLLSSIFHVLYTALSNRIRDSILTHSDRTENFVITPYTELPCEEFTKLLQNIRTFHGHLNRMVKMSSDAFGWLLFVQFVGCFSVIILLAYAFISGYLKRDPIKIAMMSFYMAFMIFKLVAFCVKMEGVTTEANSALADLQQISIRDLAPGCRREVKMMIQKLSCEPPAITAANFFTINRRLLTSAAGAITTYLVILIQFNLSEPM